MLSNSDGHEKYLVTIREELKAVQNRVRFLVRHWSTDGHFKEAMLRNMIRRFLPESLIVGTGFIVSARGVSTEIDILVVDRNMPTLFKEGELLIVTPESVRAIIEVKTNLRGSKELNEAMHRLSSVKDVATAHVRHKTVWAGLFVYEGVCRPETHNRLLESVYSASDIRDERTIDCISFGQNCVVKYFPRQDEDTVRVSNSWHSFHLPNLAPAYFISALLEAMVPRGYDHGAFIWSRMPKKGHNVSFVERQRDRAIVDFKEWLSSRHEK